MRVSRSGAVVLAAALALLVPGTAAAAGPVNVSLYWASGAATAQAVIVPVGGTVQVMMQYGSDGGYEARVTAVADAAVFTTDGPASFHSGLEPGMVGGWSYALWTFTAVGAGSTTFGAEEVRPFGSEPGTAHALQLVARADDVAALDSTVTAAGRCDAGYTIVGVGIGDHVAIRLDSNATTGYLWREASVPNTAAFRPDDPQGAYTAPGPGAPIGAGGYQTFGYTGLAAGGAPLDLVYARPDGTVGSRCAPTVSVGAAATPGPTDDTIVPTDQPEVTAPPEVTATPPATSGEGPATPMGPGSVLLALAAIAAAAGAVATMARTRRTGA